MQAQVFKEFRFDAGHRLMKHLGKCHNLHGHTYRVRVQVMGEINEKNGMVIDFGVLKEVVQPHIDFLDHAFIANPNDKKLIELCEAYNWKLAVMPVDLPEPTAENIAIMLKRWILVDLRNKGYNVPVTADMIVEVYETPTSGVLV